MLTVNAFTAGPSQVTGALQEENHRADFMKEIQFNRQETKNCRDI